jgi:hypothetical protein
VTCCALLRVPWGQALITGDRDEHIRISVFPESYVIHAMALGHTAFVSALVGVEGGFVSGAGDNLVISWDYDGMKRAEYVVLGGTCVRVLRAWREFVVVVGEKYVSFGGEWLMW